MKWIEAETDKPRSDVDVHVVTVDGVKGIAKYWHTTGLWITQDRQIKPTDNVAKWKYAEAT